MWKELLDKIKEGDTRSLARSISIVENGQPGYEELLQSLSFNHSKIIGVTGPPGAGKMHPGGFIDRLIGRRRKKSRRALR